MPSVSTSIIELSPHKARQFISNMVHNRKLDKAKVNDYARAISEGRWMLSGQGLIFTTDGKLLDGQHRCEAVLKANKSIRILSVHGVDATAFDVMDDGKKRSAADVVGIRKIANAKTVASILPYIWKEQKGIALNGFARMSLREADQLLDSFPEVAMSAQWWAFAKRTLSTRVCGSVAGYTHWRAGRINSVKRDEFFARFADGVGLGARSPILKLREALLKIEHNPMTELGSIILNWNRFLTNTGRFAIYDSSKMDFPTWVA